MKNIGIIVAQQEEAEPLIKRLENEDFGEDLVVHTVVSGVGKLNAMSAVYDLWKYADVDLIINIGVTAGRGEDVNVGDLFVVDKSYDGDFDISIFNHNKYYVPEVGDYIDVSERCDNTGLKKLPCFSISQFLEGDIDTEIPNYLVDMEYYGIAFGCKKMNIPCLSIKAISDTSKSDNDKEYDSNLNRCSELLADYMMNYLQVL